MRCKMQKICQFLKTIFILQVKKKTRHSTLENTTDVQILQFHECVAFYTLRTCLRSSLPQTIMLPMYLLNRPPMEWRSSTALESIMMCTM